MTPAEALSIRPLEPTPHTLGELSNEFELAHEVDVSRVVVTGVTIDSRDVHPGDLYVALPGTRSHGAQYGREAVSRGAAAILTDAEGARLLASEARERSDDSSIVPSDGPPILVTDANPRDILGEVSSRIYGTANIDVPVFGVTGTNGKTSVVYLIAELMRAAGLLVGLSSTAERSAGDTVMTSGLTSPEASELHGLLSRMLEIGVDGIVLEVSAHATVRHRVDGLVFDVVAFNNLSHDHLDDFGDMETYFAAKQQLFTKAHARRGVVVVDSAYGVRLAEEAEIPVTRLATEYGHEADWHLAVTGESLDGVSFVLQGPDGVHFRGSVPVFGRFMAENTALALIMLHEAGIGIDRVAAGLENGRVPIVIPGRLEEMTRGGAGPRFYVDYGHTPGAFTAMLDALGDVAPGRIIFMFGADGDRDPSKREEMGRIAAAGSDHLIICDYHPRTEDPAAIRAALRAGAERAGRAEITEVADPREAIRRAIALAGPDDVILYAGPGHEDYQEIGGRKVPYSARDEVRGALREAGLLG